MQTDCISFREVPGTSRLFSDYLSGAASALAFYARPVPLEVPVHTHSAEHRAVVADILVQQNRKFGASAATLANIERLRNGANAVVTGQQVGILGGPLLGILKTISAIRMAQQQNAVPVFWLATTDHDIAEVDHANIICDGALTRISAKLDVAAGDIASHAVIGSDLLAEINRCYPLADGEVRGWIESDYKQGERLGIAFAKLWSRLFAEYGLVVLDPDDARWPNAPILRAAAEQAIELNSALRERSAELARAGYHEQVLVTQSTTLLFANVEGVRTPIRMQRELTGETLFKAGHLVWRSAAELAAWVEPLEALLYQGQREELLERLAGQWRAVAKHGPGTRAKRETLRKVREPSPCGSLIAASACSTSWRLVIFWLARRCESSTIVIVASSCPGPLCARRGSICQSDALVSAKAPRRQSPAKNLDDRDPYLFLLRANHLSETGSIADGDQCAYIRSASPQSTDIGGARWHVVFVPQPDHAPQ